MPLLAMSNHNKKRSSVLLHIWFSLVGTIGFQPEFENRPSLWVSDKRNSLNGVIMSSSSLFWIDHIEHWPIKAANKEKAPSESVLSFEKWSERWASNAKRLKRKTLRSNGVSQNTKRYLM